MAGVNGYPGYVSDFVRGDTHKIKVQPTFVDENGAIQDITLSDYEFHLIFATAFSPDVDPLLKIIVPAGENLDSSLESVTIMVNGAQSESMPSGEVYYQIKMINAADITDVHTMDMGKINIMPRANPNTSLTSQNLGTVQALETI